jgi:hypothetical protein
MGGNLPGKELNELYQLFINRFSYYFMTALPLKLAMKREDKNNTWISRRIKVSCQKIKFLNNLKYRLSLSRDALSYITRYHRIYKQVISAAKKRHDK